ncbi:MAG: hypothetical protein ACO4CT_04405 [Planctomycetota bacterium]
MFLIRDLGSAVRGAATGPQIVLATTLGGMLGFVPGFFLPGDVGGGFLQAPGLIAALFLAALILDTNLFVFGSATVAAKIVSFALLPVSFELGRFLLEGPLEGVFRNLVNGPVTAWFGLEYYATTGGLLLGALAGLVTGLLIAKALQGLRRSMAGVETGSERYQALIGKRSVRLLAWLFFGSARKKSWAEAAARGRRLRVVRPLGLVVAVLVVAGLYAVQGSLGGAWLGERSRYSLAAWNGATVDLDHATLDLAEGRVTFTGLAMTDPEDLDHDAFRARTLDFDLSMRDLLAGSVAIDRIESGDAETGSTRSVPGRRIHAEPPAPPAPAPDAPGRPLEEYLADIEIWKQRLETASEWIEKFTGAGEDVPAEEPSETRDERIAEEVDVLGLARVAAAHFRTDTPAVTVRELILDGVTVAGLGADRVDVRGENLSSHPVLAGAPSLLRAAARSGAFRCELRFDPANPGTAGIVVAAKDIPLASLAGSLKDLPVRGGVVDLSLEGAVDVRADGIHLGLPLVAVLRDTEIQVGSKTAQLARLELPIGLSGPLRAPSIDVDASGLADALTAAGRAELADEVRARAGKIVGGELGDALGGVIDGTKTTEEVVDQAKQKAEDELKKRAAEELNKRLPGGLGGLLKKKN